MSANEIQAEQYTSDWFRRREIPTWLVTIGLYGSWCLLILNHEYVPLWLMLPAGAYLTALHFSLQHEAIHSWRSIPKWLRWAVVWPPLGMWFPFELYYRSHSTHHQNQQLTLPGRDTETYYHSQTNWQNYSKFWRAVLLFQQTLIGRLLIGPLLRWRKLVIVEFGLLARGDYSNVAIWCRHFIGVAILLYFVLVIADMPFLRFFFCFVYAGLSLGLLRAFIEHRYSENAVERTASVESNWFFGLLFLWNNLHIVHHEQPTLSWFEIPREYYRNRNHYLTLNHHFTFKGYAEIARQWLFKPVFSPRHPVVE